MNRGTTSSRCASTCRPTSRRSHPWPSPSTATPSAAAAKAAPSSRPPPAPGPHLRAPSHRPCPRRWPRWRRSPRSASRWRRRPCGRPRRAAARAAARAVSRELLQEQLVVESKELLASSLAGELDEVLETEVRMREVAELVSLFSTQLASQTGDVAQLDALTAEISTDVDKGHEQLIKASQRRRVARHVYVTLTLLLSFGLLVLDFVFD
mmetsp:Transcript_11107/g.26059  ORF Transcript_11107/g.26059 Transcript_11107/m.26059 type:complete len:209 (-) Transcript_11107:161-787(-)